MDLGQWTTQDMITENYITTEQYEVLTKAIETYGDDYQMNIAIEELSELQKEICKYKRGYENREHIIEEIGDVLITTLELCIIFNIRNIDLYETMERKIKRLERNMLNE